MKVLILTEGGKNAGFGHITRCLALYQALEENDCDPQLIVNADDSAVDFVEDSNHKIFNWAAEQEKLMDLINNADFLIIDSYLADKPLYDKISQVAKGDLIMIDDYNRIDYPEGIVVNPSIYGDKLKYPQKKGVTYLLGKEYIILRKEFWDVSDKTINKEVRKVLIAFGRIQNRSLIDKITSSLKERHGFDLDIVGSNGNRTNARQMLESMLKADICISGGGQTIHELARVGVPTIGICFAENQRGNLESWKEAGFLEYAGRDADPGLLDKIEESLADLMPFEKRKRASLRGKMHVDGKGSLRIARFLLKIKNRG